jgi:hypothetical protein
MTVAGAVGPATRRAHEKYPVTSKIRSVVLLAADEYVAYMYPDPRPLANPLDLTSPVGKFRVEVGGLPVETGPV